MAGSKCAYLETKMLAHVLGNTAYTAPGTIYVALSTAAFSATATGSALTEVTASDYARQTLTNNTTNFPAPSGSNPAALTNGIDIAWAAATSNWGTILSVYLIDASTNGNCLYGADLPVGVPVTTGSSFTIQTGSFVLQEF